MAETQPLREPTPSNKPTPEVMLGESVEDCEDRGLVKPVGDKVGVRVLKSWVEERLELVE